MLPEVVLSQAEPAGRQSFRATIWFSLLSLSLFLATTFHGHADSLPAVSGINGKIHYNGGDMNSATGDNFEGSVTSPVAHQFGAQADALYSRISNLDFYGGGGHFFWRDPAFGLLGITGGYIYRSQVDTYQVGTEGEYYLGPVTLKGFAGAGSIDYANPVPFIDSHPTRFVGRFSADYFPVRDLRMNLSYTSAFHESLFQAAAEYQTPLPGLALTGEVARGGYRYDHWLLGVRYYFGGKKPLIDRAREDGPSSIMSQILHGLGSYGAQFNQKGNEFLAAHPPSSQFTNSLPPYSVFGSTYGGGAKNP